MNYTKVLFNYMDIGVLLNLALLLLLIPYQILFHKSKD
jgi:hypothetical protein